MSDSDSDERCMIIESVSIYEVLPDGTRIKYEPNPEAISDWEYKLKQGEQICYRCGGVVRDDNVALHMRCKNPTLDKSDDDSL